MRLMLLSLYQPNVLQERFFEARNNESLLFKQIKIKKTYSTIFYKIDKWLNREWFVRVAEENKIFLGASVWKEIARDAIIYRHE